MVYFKKKNKPVSENADSLYLKIGSKAFKEMLDNGKDPILVKCGSDAIHYYVNRSTCEMTGHTLAELTNMRFRDLVHPEGLGNLEERWEKQRKGINLPICYETRTVTKNGKVIPVEMAVTFGKQKTTGLSYAI